MQECLFYSIFALVEKIFSDNLVLMHPKQVKCRMIIRDAPIGCYMDDVVEVKSVHSDMNTRSHETGILSIPFVGQWAIFQHKNGSD